MSEETLNSVGMTYGRMFVSVNNPWVFAIIYGE